MLETAKAKLGAMGRALKLRAVLPQPSTLFSRARQSLQLLRLGNAAGSLANGLAKVQREGQIRDALLEKARQGTLSSRDRRSLERLERAELASYEKAAANPESALGAISTVRELATLREALGRPMSTDEIAALKIPLFSRAVEAHHKTVKEIAETGDVEHAYLAARIENDLPQLLESARDHKLELPARTLMLAADVHRYYPRARALNDARVEKLRREREARPAMAEAARALAANARRDRVPSEYELGGLHPTVLLRRIADGETRGLSAEAVATAKRFSFGGALSREVRLLRRILREGNPFRAEAGAKALADIEKLEVMARQHGVSFEHDDIYDRVKRGLAERGEMRRQLEQLEARREQLAAQL